MIYLFFKTRGRIGRSVFFGYGFFAQMIFQAVFYFTSLFFGGKYFDRQFEGGGQALEQGIGLVRLVLFLGVQFSLVVVIWWLIFCLNAKRMHDVGRGYSGWPVNVIVGVLMGLQILHEFGWLIVSGLAAFLNFLIWLMLVALPGNPGKNNYGWPRSGIERAGTT